jgi:hypothetical protein
MGFNFGFTTLGSVFKTKRQQFGVSSLIFSLLIGGAFIGVSLTMLQSTKVNPSWRRVSGQVVDTVTRQGSDSTTYAAVVRYSVNGQTYRTTNSISSSSVPTVGATKEVAYNPAQPGQAKIVEGARETWWLWLFPVIGAVVVFGSLYAFVKSQKRSKNIQSLMQSGIKLQGILTDMQAAGGNHDSKYRIIVSATDNTGVVQNYVSDIVSGVGSLALADFRTKPVPIDVYVDPTNPQNYYVDLSDIPNLTPERIKELVQSAAANGQTPGVMGERSVVPGGNDRITPGM